jgi:acyl-[acyl-carrier-protein]-phospholipid O-acyltransferase / long-chain-fatty-acid--[acyl-carrier-protein] ligase
VSLIKRCAGYVLELLVYMVMRLLYPVRTMGLDKLDLTEPVVITPNHVSLIDAVLLGFLLPKHVIFVVNSRIAREYRWLVRLREHIAVDPLKPYSVRRIMKAVQAGHPVVIFPEGRITVTGSLMKMYSGAAYIALKTGVQVVPVSIAGPERSPFIYIAHKLRTHWRVPTSIQFGDPVHLEEKSNEPLQLRKQAASEKLSQLLREQWVLHRYQMKGKVQLFDELVRAASWNGPGLQVASDYNRTITYRELLLRCYTLSRQLKPVLREESRIGVLLPASIEQAAVLFTLLLLGKTPVLMDALSREQPGTIITFRSVSRRSVPAEARFVELEELQEQASWYDRLAGAMDYVRKRKAIQADRNEIILLTSDLQAVHGHNEIYVSLLQLQSILDWTSEDKLLNALPGCDSLGLTVGLLFPLLSGMRVCLHPNPHDYKVVPELSYQTRATILLGRPELLAKYGRTAHPYDFSSLRMVLSEGGQLRDDIRSLWQDKFGLRIMNGYETPETFLLTLNTPLSYRLGTAGRFLTGVEYRLERENVAEQCECGCGRLFVRGPQFVSTPLWVDTGMHARVNDGFVTLCEFCPKFDRL